MISGTVNHVKFKRLKRMLSLNEWECVGLLESLWMMTARSHICGDIGKSDNIDIAAAIEWDQDEDLLVSALVKCGWLDEHPVHRLVVHDWNIHCPNHVKGNIARHGKSFANLDPRETPMDPPRESPRDASVEPPMDPPTKPSQAKPNQDISILPAEAVKVTDLIVEHCLSLNPTAKSVTKQLEKTRFRWSEAIDKINRIDGKSWPEIEDIARWAINDSFWRTNVLSGDKLRKQFDTLVIQRNAANNPKNNAGNWKIKEPEGGWTL